MCQETDLGRGEKGKGEDRNPRRLRFASEMDSFCLELVERSRTGIFRGQHLDEGGFLQIQPGDWLP